MIFSVNQKVAVPCYTPESYVKLLECDEEKKVHFKNYEAWKNSKDDLEIQLLKHGIKIKEVYIDIDDLLLYCRLNDVKNTARIRAQYALLKSGDL